MKLQRYPIDIPPAVKGQIFGVNPTDYAQFGLKGHNGIDFPAPLGTPVYAAADGQMEHTTDGGYGINARVFCEDTDHPGERLELTYGHFQRYEGGPGPVKAGQVIGYVDSTGYSTGNHLHFGIRRWNDKGIINYDNGFLGYIDPAPYLQGDTMNQAVVVKSKHGNQVYICYKVPDMDYLQKTCNIQAINLPNPIPDSDTL